MRLSGVLIATAALIAALVASEPAPAAAGHAKSGGIYPWYRYGYNFPPPYGATPPPAYPAYLVTGRSVATGLIINSIVRMAMTTHTAVLSLVMTTAGLSCSSRRRAACGVV
jgi:hypothetical protein